MSVPYIFVYFVISRIQIFDMYILRIRIEFVICIYRRRSLR